LAANRCRLSHMDRPGSAGAGIRSVEDTDIGFASRAGRAMVAEKAYRCRVVPHGSASGRSGGLSADPRPPQPEGA